MIVHIPVRIIIHNTYDFNHARLWARIVAEGELAVLDLDHHGALDRIAGDFELHVPCHALIGVDVGQGVADGFAV